MFAAEAVPISVYQKIQEKELAVFFRVVVFLIRGFVIGLGELVLVAYYIIHNPKIVTTL